VKRFDDPRIRYIRHGQNRGAPVARNTGILAARGKYIAFLDSDDEWLPKKLEHQVKVLDMEPGNVGVVYTRFWWVREGKSNVLWPRKCVEGSIHVHQLYGRNTCTTSCILVRASCFNVVGLFDEDLSAKQEDDLQIRLSQKFEFRAIKVPLVRVHTGDANRISGNARVCLEGSYRIILKIEQKLELSDLLKRRVVALRRHRLGRQLISVFGEVHLGKQELKLAWKTWPFNWKYLAFWILSTNPRFYALVAQMRNLFQMNLDCVKKMLRVKGKWS